MSVTTLVRPAPATTATGGSVPIDAATRPEDARQDGLRWWENDRFAIGWKGHLYLPGEAGGAPSVARIGAALGSADFAEVAARAAGVFGLFVHDKRRGGWQVAVDNAGLYKIFETFTQR